MEFRLRKTEYGVEVQGREGGEGNTWYHLLALNSTGLRRFQGIPRELGLRLAGEGQLYLRSEIL